MTWEIDRELALDALEKAQARIARLEALLRESVNRLYASEDLRRRITEALAEKETG